MNCKDIVLIFEMKPVVLSIGCFVSKNFHPCGTSGTQYQCTCFSYHRVKILCNRKIVPPLKQRWFTCYHWHSPALSYPHCTSFIVTGWKQQVYTLCNQLLKNTKPLLVAVKKVICCVYNNELITVSQNRFLKNIWHHTWWEDVLFQNGQLK